MSRRGTRAALLGFLVALAVPMLAVGCAAMPDERRSTFGIDFRLPEPPKQPGAVVFFVDGVSPTVFLELLDAGSLPNIRKYFADRGCTIERCVANIPTVTLANETSFVTGLFPGHHGITGINWFDRNRLLWRNYETIAQKNTLDGDYIARTIFEYLPDEMTFSLFFQAHRGATKFTENALSAVGPYWVGWYNFVDRIALWRFDIVAEVSRKRGRLPALVVAYLLAPDMEAYRSGVSSEAYRETLVHTDAHIGRILRDYEKAGLLENLILVLVSDHGMTDIQHHWPIGKFLRDDVRLAVAGEGYAEDIPFEKRLNYYGKFSCVLAGSGERYWTVHLRKPRPAGDGAEKSEFENWLPRPSPEDLRAYPARDGRRVDLIETLRSQEAVDLVAYRAEPGRVHLVTKKGTAEVTGDGRMSAYRVVRGNDPLSYGDIVPPEMLLGLPHDAQEWLEATADTRYPDLVPQILAYFEAPLAGDLAVFAAPGWDFGTRLKAGHGGLGPEDMFVPLLMAGPGVPHLRRPGPVRAVDVMPTLLDLLGRPVPPNLDGRTLVRHRHPPPAE
jgi:hypothetical protein